jgi:hypothetical protein
MKNIIFLFIYILLYIIINYSKDIQNFIKILTHNNLPTLKIQKKWYNLFELRFIFKMFSNSAFNSYSIGF